MEFGVLGPLEVLVGGEALALGSAQQRAVLALLIVHAPEPVSLDRLIDELWGERPPATAQHAVQVYVSGIRKLLRAAGGAEAVAVRNSPSGYVIEVDPERIDARRFERLLDEAQSVLARDPSALSLGCCPQPQSSRVASTTGGARAPSAFPSGSQSDSGRAQPEDFCRRSNSLCRDQRRWLPQSRADAAVSRRRPDRWLSSAAGEIFEENGAPARPAIAIVSALGGGAAASGGPGSVA